MQIANCDQARGWWEARGRKRGRGGGGGGGGGRKEEAANGEVDKGVDECGERIGEIGAGRRLHLFGLSFSSLDWRFGGRWGDIVCFCICLTFFSFFLLGRSLKF